ncbi:hypothetical protein BDW22DRAFT_620566 [Trametopsis cervina]|nr:hypothetical protein BDW22DRAFT_620566 [Trametopsis cervina]
MAHASLLSAPFSTENDAGVQGYLQLAWGDFIDESAFEDTVGLEDATVDEVVPVEATTPIDNGLNDGRNLTDEGPWPWAVGAFNVDENADLGDHSPSIDGDSSTEEGSVPALSPVSEYSATASAFELGESSASPESYEDENGAGPSAVPTYPLGGYYEHNTDLGDHVWNDEDSSSGEGSLPSFAPSVSEYSDTSSSAFGFRESSEASWPSPQTYEDENGASWVPPQTYEDENGAGPSTLPTFTYAWYSDVKEGSQLKRKRSSWYNNEDEDGHLLETSGPRMENKRFRFQFTDDQHIALPSLMATEAQLAEPEVATGTETSGTAIAPGFTGEEATGAATFNTGLTLGFSEGAAGAGTLEMPVVPAAAEPTQAALAETTLNNVPALVAVLDANEETGTVCPFDGCTARFTLRTLRTDSPLGHHLFAVHMNGRKFTKKEKYPCPGDGVLSTCTHGLREYKEPSASNRALGRHFKAEHLGIEISWPCRIPGCKSGNNGQPKKLSRKDNRNNHERRCIARQTE